MAQDPSRDEMLAFIATLPCQSEIEDFDREAAIYWFANDWHGGQWSSLYSALSTSEYRPGMVARGPEPESMESMLYDALVSQYTS